MGEIQLRVRHSGSGPRVLLHGHPRTHATWQVAPMLAGQFTVVCPDLVLWRRGSPWTIARVPRGYA
ncbi:MAG TPA: hypothetical protein VG253_18770 [Streptosporangiaceae bacterium]|nr:hypothetical protein [Streptosporangiaceae bacterium]